jgi:hypothetical protein
MWYIKFGAEAFGAVIVGAGVALLHQNDILVLVLVL